MVSVDAEAGEAVPPPQPAPPAASPAAGGSGEVVVLKAHYGSTAVPRAAHQVARRNSPRVGLVKGTPKLSVASKSGQPGSEDAAAAAAAAAEGEPRCPARASNGVGSSRGPSVFDHVERYVQPRWKTRVARVMDGVPYTLGSMLITLLVRRCAASRLLLLKVSERALPRCESACCTPVAGGGGHRQMPFHGLGGCPCSSWRRCLLVPLGV